MDPPAGAVTRLDLVLVSRRPLRRPPHFADTSLLNFSQEESSRRVIAWRVSLACHIILQLYDGTREYYRLLILEIIAEGCIAVRQIIGPGQNALSANVGRVIKLASGEALFSHSLLLVLGEGVRSGSATLPPVRRVRSMTVRPPHHPHTPSTPPFVPTSTLALSPQSCNSRLTYMSLY